jgi:plasmid stabilization system protein ParE
MKVRLLPRAQQDLLEIDAWLERERPFARGRVVEALLEGLARLERLPLTGPVARDEVLRRRGYRTLARKPYVTFYRVQGSTVLVVRILHQRRSWRHLL